jgi:hypothetical protein
MVGVHHSDFGMIRLKGVSDRACIRKTGKILTVTGLAGLFLAYFKNKPVKD